MTKGIIKFLGAALACCLTFGIITVTAEAAWEKKDGICYNSNGDVIEGAILKGIDVSAWQETIDWDRVANTDVDFAFIRAGHGDEPLDKKYNYNMSNANRVGMPVGVYFYSMATSVERSIKDAQFVINHLQGYTVSYPVVVDMESDNQLSLTKDQRTDIAIAFCEEIRRAGYYPMVYCNEYWYKNHLDTKRLAGYDKWVARYQPTYDTSIPRQVWQATNSGTVDGISEKTDIDFAFVDYSSIITPRSTSDPSYVPSGGGWKQNSTGYWYERADSSYPVNQWELIDGSWYHFDGNGYMQTEWFHDDGIWYYLSANGKMQTGWYSVNGIWYFSNGSGAMQTGWIKDGATWYFTNESGAMQTGWINDRGTWYFAVGSGAMQTGWINDRGTWYYLYGSGAMAAGWVMVNGTWYYCSGSGAMQTGWINDNGTWYYCYSSGAMAAGWLYDGKSWYYCNRSGQMLTGWIKDGGVWYYCGGSGAMQTGWINDNGTWYYCGSSGAMAANTWIGEYYVGKSGAWIQ